MNRLHMILLAFLTWSGSFQAGESAMRGDTQGPATQFTAVDVLIDSGNVPLAAYQLSFTVTNTPARIVGIEGSEHAAFKEPPYYDPKAIQGERAILAAFSTAARDQLPKGKVRVATIHLQVPVEKTLECAVHLQVAAGSNGETIRCSASYNRRKTP